MTPHSERTDDVGQEIGNERHIAIVNIAQSPMAHELELIEKPDSEQRNDKCIKEHLDDEYQLPALR